MYKQSDIFKSFNTKFDDSLGFIEGRIDIHDIPEVQLYSDRDTLSFIAVFLLVYDSKSE